VRNVNYRAREHGGRTPSGIVEMQKRNKP